MINENEDFTIEDSEGLINNLTSNSAPEFEELRTTLNLLSHVNELSPISSPPLLPSEIGQPVQLLTRKSSKSRRTAITSILSVGLLVSASLAAAAVTGRGPAPIVNAGHESAKFVKAVAGAVSQVVTGNNSDSPTKISPTKNGGSDESGKKESNGQSGDSEHSLTGPSSLPLSAGSEASASPEGDGGNSDSSSDSSNNSGISLSITVSPKSKSDHAAVKGSKEGEKNHSSNDGSHTPTATPSPEPTSSPGDGSSGDESD